MNGEGGIRTRGTRKGHTGFRNRLDQPLRHLSITIKNTNIFHLYLLNLEKCIYTDYEMILQEYKQKRFQVRKKTYTTYRQKIACFLFSALLSSSELIILKKGKMPLSF